MRKVLLGFIILFCSVSLFAVDPVSVTLKGTVPGVASLDLSTEAVVSNLDFSDNYTESDLLIGTLTERTNNKQGYTVELESTNGFAFYNATVNESFVYTLKYNGDQISLDASNKSTITDVNSKTTGTGVEKEIRISYTVDFVSPELYEDTLTFTMILK